MWPKELSVFLRLLDQQLLLGLSGKINITLGGSNQILGHLWIHQGKLSPFTFKGSLGEEGVWRFVAHLIHGPPMQFVCEPELPDEFSERTYRTRQLFLKELSQVLLSLKKSMQLRPPGELVIRAITPPGPSVSGSENLLLNLIQRYSKVEEIYRHSPFLDLETTHYLVHLRLKKMIQVEQLAYK